MHGDWLREIHREYAGGDARFELLVHPLGWGRVIGLFFAGFGLAFLWSPARDVWRTLQKWLHETPGGFDLIAGLFNLPFLFAGCVALAIGLLTSSIHMGRRTAALEVDAGRLRVETRGLFGTKRREWTRADINAIRADASGMEVNERPVIELQIHPCAGKKMGLLAGRKEDELCWMASRLRRALNVPARNPEPSSR